MSPSTPCSRGITEGDVAVWVNGSLKLQVLAAPKRQGMRWLTECESVG
jgi:hypothetical protein